MIAGPYPPPRRLPGAFRRLFGFGQYVVDLPGEVGDLRLAYEDSIAVFTPREETRAKLGEGFQYWYEANFPEMIRFFQPLIEVGDLT